MDRSNFRQTIFIPVGTTIIQKAKTLYPKSKRKLLYGELKEFKSSCYPIEHSCSGVSVRITWQDWRNSKIGDNYHMDYADSYKEEVDPEKEIKRRKNKEFSEGEPDNLTAELAGLYLFYEDLRPKAAVAANQVNLKLKDEIILLASDTNEGLYSACFLAEYLTEIAPFRDNIGEVIVELIGNLGGGQGDLFQEQGLNNLVEQTAKLIGERQGKNPLYLNITGGFKGALPYLTLLGLAFGDMDVFYLFEFAPNLVWLPKIPVGFDLLTWRDYRTFIRSIPHIVGFKEEYLPAFIPDSMRMLLKYETESNSLELSALGKALYMQYEKERGKGISEHGRGYLLTDLIKCSDKRSAILNCIDCWQYLWIGDLIPETVEHGRGHVQRDLELLAQIIYPILKREPRFFNENDAQNDDNLLVLLSAIWLHDLGHSGSYLECDNKDGALEDGSSIKLNIKGFPSMVRDIHHLLSWYLIKTDQYDLFKLDLNLESDGQRKIVFNDVLVESIRQACLYHRGKMPATKGNFYEHVGIKIVKPLDEILNTGGVNLPLIGALLRMADEGEVQRERTVSEEYEKMRILQNKRELQSLMKEEGLLRKALKTKLECSDSIDGVNTGSRDTMQKVLKVADEYFSNINSDDTKDKVFDENVDKFVREYFSLNNKTLGNTDNVFCIAYRSWFSILNQYIFKKRQPAHFEKHRGISYLMYLTVEEDGKTNINSNQEHHYRVLAIYRKGKDSCTTDNYIKNAENVLKGINDEYEKVKGILNKHRIYFDSYWIMEQDEKNQIEIS